MYVTDGSDAGTVRLNAAGLTGQITDLKAVGSMLYFVHNGSQLWKSDGTAGGTAQVGTRSAARSPS